MVVATGYICSSKIQQRKSCLMASCKSVPIFYSYLGDGESLLKISWSNLADLTDPHMSYVSNTEVHVFIKLCHCFPVDNDLHFACNHSSLYYSSILFVEIKIFKFKF